MEAPHITIVHDRVGGPTGMGKVVEFHARTVLAAGWRLSVVTSDLTTELPGALIRLVPVERRLPGLAQHLNWMRRVRRDLHRSRSDLVHVHAPGLADVADLVTSHYLAACARARGVRAHSTSSRLQGLRNLQETLSVAVDDRFYRAHRDGPAISFVSQFLRSEYTARYGPPKGGAVLPPPAPAPPPDLADLRTELRTRLGLDGTRIVVGYLGGTSALKGYASVAELAGEPDIELLVAGPGSESVELGGRRGFGFVAIDEFLPACDVLVAPSLFDSAPVSVLEALAAGVRPVVGTGCGWATTLDATGGGVVWRTGSLAEAVRAAAAIDPARCAATVEQFSPQRIATDLLETYRGLLARRSSPARSGVTP